MQSANMVNPPAEKVSVALTNFTGWLENYGEVSWDHQSFFAGPVGRRAKGLYYKNKLLGTPAVAPMIFCEAFIPAARRLFHQPMRLPIADAHYAMGFAFLHEATGNPAALEKAVHFLEVLKATRSPGFKEFGWGYPFDWVWRGGVIKAHTPLITTTPYVFEAFLQVFRLLNGHSLAPSDGERAGVRGAVAPSTLNSQLSTSFKAILESIVRHACTDFKDFKFSETASTCSYTPDDEGGVVNASAYRAFLLTSAAKFLGDDSLLKIAGRNLNFVLESQNADGSWPYAKDGVRDFVDHFHTCFVMKALAKIYLLSKLRGSRGNEAQTEKNMEPPHVGCYNSGTGTGDPRILAALTKGVDYYLKNLFGEDGMPRPFSKAPRLTVYKCELYDCAECINLCLLLRKDFPQLDQTLQTVVAGILENWIKPDGSFRSRKLMFGWDNVPMHRWAQSQMFRALAFYLREKRLSTISS
jgi:hypothetical protein